MKWALLVTVVVTLGCGRAPVEPPGSICNLPLMLSWTRADYDRCFGPPVSPYRQPDGSVPAEYTYQGTVYAPTFATNSPQATITDILIVTAEGFDKPRGLLYAVGLHPAPAITNRHPERIVYSTAGTSLVELAVTRTVGKPWSQVRAQTVGLE